MVASCIAAYLSYIYLWGFLMMDIRSFGDFIVTVVPMALLPVALLGFRYPTISATLSLLVLLLLFGSLFCNGVHVMDLIWHYHLDFFKFLSVTVLLAVAALIQRKLQTSGN